MVCQWVFELADKQRKHTLAQFHNPKSTPESDKCETTLTVKTATPDVCCTNEPQPQLARESPAGSSGGRDVLLLREMFPDATEEELSSVLSRCEGNVEEAIQELLDDPESNVVRERRKGVEPTEQVYFIIIIMTHARCKKKKKRKREKKWREDETKLFICTCIWCVMCELIIRAMFRYDT